MRASIIIPAHNAQRTLARCVGACLSQAYPDFEVIVVDDGSTDATASIAREIAGITRIQQENQGPAAARNRGAEAATGDILVFTDADCVPEPDWLARLLSAFEDGVAGVGGTYMCANPERRLARVIQAEIARRHAQFGDRVDFLGSFNVAYRADVFRAVGGFDESYRQASGEDNDLAYRIEASGGLLRFTSEATVAHYHPDRLWRYLRTQARHGYWRVKLYRDHPARARGDQYAGLPDLIAPPLALLGAALAPALAAAQALGWNAARLLPALASVWTVTALLHAPLIRQMRGALAPADLLYFGLVLLLRDVARAAGLCRGFWDFQVRGGS